MHSGGKKNELEHKGHLVVVLAIIRFLLLQGLAFRGHDESASSTNKGVFWNSYSGTKTRIKM
jgi:hypothetical protein